MVAFTNHQTLRQNNRPALARVAGHRGLDHMARDEVGARTPPSHLAELLRPLRRNIPAVVVRMAMGARALFGAA